MNNLLIFFFCLTGIEREPIIEETVDYIEINHVYDNEGLPQADQLIFWDLSLRKDYKYKYCIDWRRIDGKRKPVSEEENKRLRKIYTDAGTILPNDFQFTKFVGLEIPKDRFGNYQFMFYDDRDHVLRKIKTKSILETWVTYDNEYIHRNFQLSQDRKRLLRFDIK